jgi:hypothetical protein
MSGATRRRVARRGGRSRLKAASPAGEPRGAVRRNGRASIAVARAGGGEVPFRRLHRLTDAAQAFGNCIGGGGRAAGDRAGRLVADLRRIGHVKRQAATAARPAQCGGRCALPARWWW